MTHIFDFYLNNNENFDLVRFTRIYGEYLSAKITKDRVDIYKYDKPLLDFSIGVRIGFGIAGCIVKK